MTTETTTLEGGKYTIVRDALGVHALRNGEPWRVLTGDKLVLALVHRVEALEAALQTVIDKFDSEIHSEYDGTSMLSDRLAEVGEQRALLKR